MDPRPPSPRKRLGQHFLVDHNLSKKIVAFADLTSATFVCEIGPGAGALTRYLCQASAEVLAVEVDPRMVEYLRTEMGDCSNLELRQADALKFSYEDLPPSTVVVANLPYNISTPLLFRLLEAPNISRMVLTIQLEVANRLVAGPGTKAYGILSVMAQFYASVRYGFPVSRKCFRPVPDVDSGVIRLDRRSMGHKKPEEMRQFQQVVRAAFGQRRKTLFNALRGAGFSETHLQHVQEVSDIQLTRRAETLTVVEFQTLTRDLVFRTFPSVS